MLKHNKIKINRIYLTLLLSTLLSFVLPCKANAQVVIKEESLKPATNLNHSVILAQNTNPQLGRDPNLVGLWIRSDSQCSYGNYTFCFAGQLKMLIKADGTFYQGGYESAGGGPGATFTSGPNGWNKAEWATANRIVYGRLNSSQPWTPVARYYIEGNSMLLTSGDGTREIWERRR